jgi:hypothetical protein
MMHGQQNIQGTTRYLVNEVSTLVLTLVTAEMGLEISVIQVSHLTTLPDVISYSDF